MQARPASTDDAAFLWTLANEPSVRAASLSTGAIPWSRHLDWLRRELDNPHALCYVLWDGPVEQGVVRAERAETGSVVSVSLTPDARGQGRGVEAIRFITQQARVRFGTPVLAYIRSTNAASLQAFTRAGYRPLSRSPDPQVKTYAFR